MIHAQAHCCDEVDKHQLPIAAAFWIIQIFSVEECTNLRQNLMQICCSTQSFWMWQSHSTHLTQWLLPPYWVVQWSCGCSCMLLPVHSPWLPGYIDVLQLHYISNSWTFSVQTSYLAEYQLTCFDIIINTIETFHKAGKCSLFILYRSSQIYFAATVDKFYCNMYNLEDTYQ